MTLIVTPSDLEIYQVKLPRIKLPPGATNVFTVVETQKKAEAALAQIEAYERYNRLYISTNCSVFYAVNPETRYETPLTFRINVERMPGRVRDLHMLEEMTNHLATALEQTRSGFAILTAAGRELYRSETIKLKF